VEYIPYQGEGIEGHEYILAYAPENALITTNGTGAAPIPGIQDVFPFNRQLPIVTQMPSLPTWQDAELMNQALLSEIDSNFVAKQFSNIEHTLATRLHTNDFIEPIHGDKRRKIKLMNQAGRRGFGKAAPHVGFAIPRPKPRSVLGDNLQTTAGPVTLYVHNLIGNDNNDGMGKQTAKKTIKGAILALPPVLRHPVSIVLVDTGQPYSVKDLQPTDLTQALFGDGGTRSLRYYCLGELAFTMQEQARITIGRENTFGERIVIDATGNLGFGDGPTFAFLVADSRVILHGITFKGFTTAAVKIIDSDVELLDCGFTNNLNGVSAEQGSSVTFNGGFIALDSGGIGTIASGSQVLVNGTQFRVLANSAPQAFFVAERSSTLDLQAHNILTDPTMETGILTNHVIALVQMGSTLVCQPTFISGGKCKLQTNSTLVRSVSVSPFVGSIDKDPSTSDVANL
jgi:hypothetical protein